MAEKVRIRGLGFACIAACLVCMVSVGGGRLAEATQIGSVERIKVVATMPVFHSMVAGLVEGIDEVELAPPLLKGEASFHAFDLKPSQVRALNAAKLVIWFGPAMETSLIPVMKRQPEGSVFEVQEVKGLMLLRFREASTKVLGNPRKIDRSDRADAHDDSHGHDHGHGHGYEAGGHAHGHSVDPHVWLDPLRMRRVADVLSDRLRLLLSAEGRNRLSKNWRTFDTKTQKLGEAWRKIAARLKPLAIATNVDALNYVADRLGLKNIFIIDTDGEHRPKVKSAQAVAQAMGAGKVDCVINDAALGWSVTSLAGGAKVRSASFNSKGTDVALGREFYSQLIERAMVAMRSCVGD